MGYRGSYDCEGITFDVYDIERVNPNLTNCKYFVTPKRQEQIHLWILQNKKDITKDKLHKEDALFFIENNIIGTY